MTTPPTVRPAAPAAQLQPVPTTETIQQVSESSAILSCQIALSLPSGFLLFITAEAQGNSAVAMQTLTTANVALLACLCSIWKTTIN